MDEEEIRFPLDIKRLNEEVNRMDEEGIRFPLDFK